MRRFYAAIIGTLLFALTFVIFSRVLGADFVRWDDPAIISENPHLGGLSWPRIAWAFTDFESMARYVPLTLLGWSLTYDFCKLDPTGYHLGNLLLHCGNCPNEAWFRARKQRLPKSIGVACRAV